MVRAVSESMVEHTSDQLGNGANGSYDLEGGATAATRAVHGGERAGRPRVSGALALGGELGGQAGQAGGHAAEAPQPLAAGRPPTACPCVRARRRRLADDPHRPDVHLHL